MAEFDRIKEHIAATSWTRAANRHMSARNNQERVKEKRRTSELENNVCELKEQLENEALKALLTTQEKNQKAKQIKIKSGEGILKDLSRLDEQMHPLYQKYSQVQDQLQTEWLQIKKFEHAQTPDHGLVVALGVTGSGKSAFCNRFAGDTSEYGEMGQFKVGEELKSETCKESIGTDPQNTCSIVDTPGAHDSERQDRLFNNQLIDFLRGCGGVSMFLLFYDLGTARLDEKYQDLLKSYEDTFGPEFWNHVAIVATKADTKRPDRLPKLVPNVRLGMIDKIGLFSKNSDIQRLCSRECSEGELHPRSHFMPVFEFGWYSRKKQIEQYKSNMEKIKDLCQNNEKFECDELKSPFEELKTYAEKLYDELCLLTEEYEKVRAELVKINKQIRECNAILIGDQTEIDRRRRSRARGDKRKPTQDATVNINDDDDLFNVPQSICMPCKPLT